MLLQDNTKSLPGLWVKRWRHTSLPFNVMLRTCMDDKDVSETHLYSSLRPTKVTVQMEAKHETIYLVSNLYGSRKRGATVSKYKLIEFITVCAAEKGSDSMVTLHSPFQLLSFFPRIFFTLSCVCVFSLPWNRFVTFSNDLQLQTEGWLQLNTQTVQYQYFANFGSMKRWFDNDDVIPRWRQF